MKCHIAGIKGNITACPKATEEDKRLCREAVLGNVGKKDAKKEQEKAVRKEVDIVDIETLESQAQGKKKPRFLGPIDEHVSQINVEETMPRNTRQQSIHDALSKKRSQEVHQYMGRWVYENGVAFNQVDNDSFKRLVEAIGQFGPGYQPPSQYLLREPILKNEVERTKSLLKNQEEEWATNGCSIMTDAWSDGCRRSIMNLCVNCQIGTAFIASKEASNDAHTGEFIFEYVDECIEKIGAKNVVQIVTDNASNNMAAKDLMLSKRPQIFWTSCATHTINLMLEGIGKLPIFKKKIEQAKAFTVFVYSHHKTLALMRKTTKKEIIRPGVTRFATAFLTLQSLIEKRNDLRQMVHSVEWDATKWSKSKQGKAAYATVVSATFWSGVALTLKVFEPLVKVLRLVDGDVKPAMPFVYGELRKAKNEIKVALNNKENKYKSILSIVDSKGKGRLDTPLHLMAYMLNPFYYYKDELTWSDKEREEIISGVLDCLERLIPDIETCGIVFNEELPKYQRKKGLFGRQMAIIGCAEYTFDPVKWWSSYGSGTPNLRKIAMRILALTTSSSGCERSWSVFEGIHTKKRNRLDTKRMESLVFVQFNSRLMDKKKRRSDKIDALIANTAHNAQSWMVDGIEDEEVTPESGLTWKLVGEASGANEELQPRRSSRNVLEVREPDEDDFVSDGSCTEDDADDEEFEFDFEPEKEELTNVGIVAGEEELALENNEVWN